MKIKLSQWAKENGYTYQGAYTKFRRGDFPNATQDEYGTIRVDVSSPSQSNEIKSAVLYCRCSSSKQKDDLELNYNETFNQIYPFRMLCIGESFIVPFEDVKERTIRDTVSSYSSECDKRYSLKKWKEWKCYEIGRIA